LILEAAGIDPAGDQSAQGLYQHFITRSTEARELGSLAFFGKSKLNISHIGWCLDSFRMIHAGGGDRSVLTAQDAAKKNAFIKINLIEYRPDLIAVLKPDYAVSRNC
jgi:hypothetical protein